MLPMLPLVALAGLGLLLASKKSGGGGGAAPGEAPSVSPTATITLQPGTGLFDPNLPLVLEQTTSRMLATDNNAAELQDFASSLLPDYPVAAAALDAKAAALGAPPLPPQPPSTVPAPVIPPIFVPLPPPASKSPAPPTFLPPTPVPTPPIEFGPGPGTPAPAPAPSAGPPPWDPSMTASGPYPAIPTVYRATSQETNGVQSAVNAWGAVVGYTGAPLTTDGTYGPKTQQGVADFQSWHNAVDTSEAPLAVDGLAGPETQQYLDEFGPIPGGAY